MSDTRWDEPLRRNDGSLDIEFYRERAAEARVRQQRRALDRALRLATSLAGTMADLLRSAGSRAGQAARRWRDDAGPA